MAPVPKKHLSKVRQGKRRATLSVAGVRTVSCKNCNSPKLPHRICPSCNTYKTRSY
ncbi:50S ribosomal protein L32 [Candidatus Curtissbacteria bacterium]|nr:50S ribosomal protein L32 [Candidatus Curtissbacteria bacterium]